MRVRRAPLAALGLALTAAPLAAAAAPACDVSLSMVDFGRIRYKEGSDITGQLTVTCDGPTAFELSASPGYGSYDVRTMLGPKGTVLRYNIYVDAARRRVWGDGEAGTARIAGQSDGRKAVGYTIYGRLLDGQSVRSGSYRDSVKVSLSR
ncbi:MAG TPA: spore coat U domain-containing protein [Geminicoccaceae bacterium]|nr:spore coat U domain-containing protein [Geminicoccaceae bacterium]